MSAGTDLIMVLYCACGLIGDPADSRVSSGALLQLYNTKINAGDDDDEDDGISNVSRREHHCLTCMREHA